MVINYQKLPRRDILCVDIKSFFASVEAVRRGLHPLEAYIIVLSDLNRPGAIVLASTPRVKKEFGIKTGSRKFEIPEDNRLIITEPSMGLYLEKNIEICNIFRRYVAEEDLWIYSIDEAFLDVSETRKLFGSAEDISRKIQSDILNESGLVMAVGMGDNPLLAKLALDNEAKKKTYQFAYWAYEDVPNTVWKIPSLTDMWGISKGYEKQLRDLGITSVYKLAHSDKEVLQRRMGIMGLQLYYHSHGVDYSRLSERIPAKSHSYSKGQILMEDYKDPEKILFVITEMVEEVAARLRKNGMHCSGIGLVVGYSKYETADGFKKDRKLPRATNQTSELAACFRQVFDQHWSGQNVRQLYVACHHVTPASFTQPDLFSAESDDTAEKVDQVVDQIRTLYGKTAVFKGYHLAEGSTFLNRSGYIGGHKGSS